MTSITSLVGDHKNARRHIDRSSQLIKESLQKYGAARSIVIDEENRILAGNGTIEGAKAAGIKNVRIIETDGNEVIAVKRIGLSEDEKVGLALADNRTADLSEWDAEMLHQLGEEHDISWFDQEDLDEPIQRPPSSIPLKATPTQTKSLRSLKTPSPSPVTSGSLATIASSAVTPPTRSTSKNSWMARRPKPSLSTPIRRQRRRTGTQKRQRKN